MSETSDEKLELSILIPCLDERGTILDVIEDAHSCALKIFPKRFEIVVADNGSSDGTCELLEKCELPIRVVHVNERGYGAALDGGIKECRGRYVLFADADMSYPFLNLQRFKDALSGDPDMVLGSRFTGEIRDGAMPVLNRYLATPVLSALIRYLHGVPTTDCNSGMRAVRREFYKSLNCRKRGMEWASETLIAVAKHGGHYTEIPIIFEKDQRGRPSHLSRWSDGWKHLRGIVTGRFERASMLPAAVRSTSYRKSGESL